MLGRIIFLIVAVAGVLPVATIGCNGGAGTGLCSRSCDEIEKDLNDLTIDPGFDINELDVESTQCRMAQLTLEAYDCDCAETPVKGTRRVWVIAMQAVCGGVDQGEVDSELPLPGDDEKCTAEHPDCEDQSPSLPGDGETEEWLTCEQFGLESDVGYLLSQSVAGDFAAGKDFGVAADNAYALCRQRFAADPDRQPFCIVCAVSIVQTYYMGLP